MRTALLRRLVVAVITIVATAFAADAAFAGAAAAATPIAPGQHFIGVVDGSGAGTTSVPTVFTVCPGPVTKGGTGPVAGGQTLSVEQVKEGGGFTGPFSQVNAWFLQDSSVGGPQQVTFVEYGQSMLIPSSVRVPCSGPGQLEFSSCPRWAPCAFGWVPLVVPVQFVNIAR